MMKLPWCLLAMIPVVLSPAGCASSEKSADRTRLEAGLDSLVHRWVDAKEDVHSVVLLVEGPDFRWAGAAGFADPETADPMRTDDQFYLASTAKMMTATAVMQLVEAGKVELDDVVVKYLSPDLMKGLNVVDGQDRSAEVTVHQLLNHTSGIADNWADDAFIELIIAEPERIWKPEETIDYVKEHCPAYFPPGAGWHYSDTNYNLLGLVIEQVTGQPLVAALRDSIFEPLGMNHTHRHFAEAERPVEAGRPTSRWYREDLVCNGLRSLSADTGGGGLYSTVDDMYRFLHAFVQDEIFRDPATRAAMLDWVDALPGAQYGLGVILLDMDAVGENIPEGMHLGTVWGHQGASSAFMYCWPERDIYLIGTLNQMRQEGEMISDAMVVISEESPISDRSP